MKIREQCNICGGEHLTDDHPNTFTDPEAHELAMVIQELQQANRELADAINVVQDRVDAVITQHRVLEERVLDLEVAWEDLVDLQKRWNRMEERVARLEALLESGVEEAIEKAIQNEYMCMKDEPPDASWRD